MSPATETLTPSPFLRPPFVCVAVAVAVAAGDSPTEVSPASAFGTECIETTGMYHGLYHELGRLVDSLD